MRLGPGVRRRLGLALMAAVLALWALSGAAQAPLVVAEGEAGSTGPSPAEVEKGPYLSREERRLVQMGLTAAGYDLGPADGIFGGRTRDALRRWQGSKRMGGTGYLTREQTEGLVALGRERRLVQMGLAAAGHDPGLHDPDLVDGIFGTRGALRAWQGSKGLDVTGFLTREQIERLVSLGRRLEEEVERLARKYPAGTKLRDCPGCPEMVVVPGRKFGHPFAVGVYEVTFGEWDACVSDGGCGGYRPNEWGWGRGRRPVVNVSWKDAKAYVAWLSGKTGETYRLLSEAEWEYVARAGTGTRYWWGDGIGRNRASCDGCGSRWDVRQTAPVGSFSANPFGLHDVHGNVSEWVEDCYGGDCGRRVLRGGSWYDDPWNLRSAYRDGSTAGYRYSNTGFRVARMLTP